MKRVLTLPGILLAFLWGDGQSAPGESSFFNLPDAEKILGQTAALTGSFTGNRNDAVIYICTYTASSPEAGTGKLGHLYCMFEQYATAETAKNVYHKLLLANQNMPDLKNFPV